MAWIRFKARTTSRYPGPINAALRINWASSIMRDSYSSGSLARSTSAPATMRMSSL